MIATSAYIHLLLVLATSGHNIAPAKETGIPRILLIMDRYVASLFESWHFLALQINLLCWVPSSICLVYLAGHSYLAGGSHKWTRQLLEST